MAQTKFLDLSGSERARRTLEQLAESLGVELLGLSVPKNIQEANDLIQQERPAFILVQPDTVYLSRPLGVKSSWFPPALAFVHGKPSEATMDNLRLRGVAVVLTPELDESQKEKFANLCLAHEWLQVRLSQMHLSQLLQSVDEIGSFLVTVSTRHAPAVSPDDWSSETKEEWYGRIYIEDSLIVHTETPKSLGADALAEMLELSDGVATVQKVYLPASQGEVRSSIQGALIRSAVAKDDKARTPVPPKPSPAKGRAPKAVPWPSSARRPPPKAPPARLSGPQGTSPARPAASAPPTGGVRPGLSATAAREPKLEAEATQAAAAPVQPAGSAADGQGSLDRELAMLVASDEALQSAAACSQDGWLEGISGKIDGETQSAAAALSLRGVQAAGQLLGFGGPQAFCISNAERAAFVACHQQKLLVARGTLPARPFDVLEKMRRLLQNSAAGAKMR